MPPKETLQNLLALADQPQLEDLDRPARVAARLKWSLERAADWRRAHRAMDKRCDGTLSTDGQPVDQLDEDAFEQLIEAEQAKVDAILAEIEAATKGNRWPRELYFGRI